ncbi:site-specific integrase, partial [Oleiphilus sp. HI0079]
MVTDSSILINRFVGMLWLEHGLSENTQQAYRKDVEL